jgi:hypothetical protein
MLALNKKTSMLTACAERKSLGPIDAKDLNPITARKEIWLTT